VREVSGYDLESAEEYCRDLARGHYENFIVGSILVPRKYIQHLYNFYAFCRHSDDLADEVDDVDLSLRLLREWREDLRECYGGKPRHPALIALQSTIADFDIPVEPFLDLISAFEQDCTVHRYATYTDLLDYCRRSANPVGRVFLRIFGYTDEQRQELSDHICTGLQLANFWQDVSEDFDRGRVYIPKEDLDRFGCSEADIAAKKMSEEFKKLMCFEVDRAESLFNDGAALIPMVSRRLGVDLALFRRGGLAILQHIRGLDYNVLTQRPKVSKLEQMGLFLRCILGL
jgi:squalene synthase HpnC